MPWAAKNHPKMLAQQSVERLLEVLFTNRQSGEPAPYAVESIVSGNREWLRQLKCEIPNLTEINLGQGDPHRRGKTVASGTLDSRKVFIKPGSIDLGGIPAALEQALNKKIPLVFPSASSIGLGVMQNHLSTIGAVDDLDAVSLDEVWRNIGYATAILDFLNFTDGHYENIFLDSVGRLVVLDLETILSPRRLIHGKPFEKSILQTGIVQKPLITDRRRITSPLLPGILQRRRENYPFVSIGETGQLELHFSKIVGGNKSFPDFGLGSLPEYESQFLSGLEEAYRDLLKADLSELCARIKAEVSGHRSRVIFSSTRNYRAVQVRFALCSNFSQAELMVERELRNSRRHKVNDSLIAKSEFEQLLVGDVPAFYMDVISGELFDSHGVRLIKEVAHTPLQELRENCDQLSIEYAERQVAIVRNQCRKVRSL